MNHKIDAIERFFGKMVKIKIRKLTNNVQKLPEFLNGATNSFTTRLPCFLRFVADFPVYRMPVIGYQYSALQIILFTLQIALSITGYHPYPTQNSVYC